MMDAAQALIETLRDWVEAGALRALDLALTRFVHQQGPESDPAVLLAVALTSERNGHGHVCLDLQGALAHPEGLLSRLRDDLEIGPEIRATLAARLSALTLDDWVERLAASPAIGNRLAADRDDGAAPLVLAGSGGQPLLYLRRYWQYESRIRDGINARLARSIDLDAAALSRLLATLFVREPGADAVDPASPDWQRLACALAVRNAFFIITGGPGTGKTTTVMRLLALLQGLDEAAGRPPPCIALAAPTGKAAARLNESLRLQIADLRQVTSSPDSPSSPAAIPTEVKTLHRLLGARPASRGFRHHAGQPLPIDILVIDEASMVDVELMAAVLEALRPEARLILIGDKDQLASVDAGAVLGDLCRRAAQGHYTPETDDWLARASGERLPAALLDPDGRPLDQAIAMLRKSYRFSAHGGIGALASLVNQAEPPTAEADRLAAVKRLFAREQERPASALGHIEAQLLDDSADPRLAELLRAGYAGYLTLIRDQDPGDQADQAELDHWATAILKAHRQFQLLTPLRSGPWGIEGLNRLAIEVLGAAGLLDSARAPGPVGAPQTWFPGRPVLVTRNDYRLSLMNGDIGITLAVPARPGEPGSPRVLRVVFPASDGGLRWLLPSRLQTVETVLAMTVHKSQGSEFTHAALVLPDRPNPILTRELLYTAITRAKERFTLLYGNDEVLGESLERQVRRVSGLGLDECP